MKKIIPILVSGVLFYLFVALHTFQPVSGNEPASTNNKSADEQLEICSVPSDGSIPDNDPVGVSDLLDVTFDLQITDLDVYLDIEHTWVGDLIVTLEHTDTMASAVIIDRPGLPTQSPSGCSGNNIKNYADDEASLTFENDCTSGANPTEAYQEGISYQPGDPPNNMLLKLFDNQTIKGTWEITVSDNANLDTGTLNKWCLRATLPGLRKMFMPTSFSVESFPIIGP